MVLPLPTSVAAGAQIPSPHIWVVRRETRNSDCGEGSRSADRERVCTRVSSWGESSRASTTDRRFASSTHAWSLALRFARCAYRISMFFHARQRPRRVSKKNESKRGTQQSRVERERRER